jgi:uncharacterized protein
MEEGAMIRSPYLRVTYNGVNITTEITSQLVDLQVVDKLSGETDELSIRLEDTDGLWRSSWYPRKRDKVMVELGYEDEVLSFGTFEVDEIESSGPPDSITIKAIAAGISKQLRSKRSSAHEGKTLKQVAQAVADANGLTVIGEIGDIQIGRVTQDRETDLGFLKRIAGDYGYVFSVRDSQLIFTDVFEIEKAGVVTKIDRTQIVSYSVKDSTKDTAASAAVSYSDPDSAEEVDFEYSEDQLEGYGVQDDFSDGARSFGKSDRFKVEKRVENTQQAERVAKTALHSANSRQVTANLELPGDPKLMAGANIELTGMRKHSGKYQLQQVSHTFSRSSGYTCSLDCNKIGSLTNSGDEIPLNER